MFRRASSANGGDARAKIDALCDISEEELYKSDELNHVESRLENFLGKIQKAKKRKREDEPNKLSPEIVGLLAFSGYLTSRDLGRLLLKTNKWCVDEFGQEFIWKAIFQSKFIGIQVGTDDCPFLSTTKAKGYEWVFRQLLREPEQSQHLHIEWEKPNTTLSLETFKMILSIRNEIDGTDIYSVRLSEEQVEEVGSVGGIQIPFEFPATFTDLVTRYPNPPVSFKIHCFRSDTNQSCCVLSASPAENQWSTFEEGRNGQPRTWTSMNFDNFRNQDLQGVLQMSAKGREMMALWTVRHGADRPIGDVPISADDVTDARSGINFGVDINFGDEPSLVLDLSVDSCGQVNSFSDSASDDGITFFSVMDTLSGWAE